MTSISVEAAATRLPDLIREAAKGEEVVLTEDEQPVTRIVPVPEERPPRVPGTARGLMWMADDFDEPLEDFREYME